MERYLRPTSFPQSSRARGDLTPLNLLSQGFLDCRLKLLEAAFEISAQMNSQRTPASLGQHLKISSGLRRLYDAERILLLRDREIGGIIAGNLQKHACVWTALISLTC